MIIQDEALLRRPCTPATLEESAEIIAQLEQALADSNVQGHPGIGLSAPQIGILKTVFIARVQGARGQHYPLNVVNGRIAQAYDKTLFRGEGCLSFPNRYEPTMRFQEVHVVDNLVEPYQFIATGLLAVVIQHELDHCQGILLPDLSLNKKRA